MTERKPWIATIDVAAMQRPPGRMDPAAWVLQDFSREEETVFAPLRERICDALETWLFDGLASAMNRYNGANDG